MRLEKVDNHQAITPFSEEYILNARNIDMYMEVFMNYVTKFQNQHIYIYTKLGLNLFLCNKVEVEHNLVDYILRNEMGQLIKYRLVIGQGMNHHIVS